MRRQISIIFSKARKTGLMTWGDDARDLYGEVYPELSRAHDGVSGGMIDRAEAMTVRLSMIYCLLAEKNCLRGDDLISALAAWRYCQDSSLYIFGETPTDRNVAKIMEALANGQLTRTEIRETIFSSHISRQQLDDLLNQMEADKLIIVEKVATSGRPETRISKQSCAISAISVLSTTDAGSKPTLTALKEHKAQDEAHIKASDLRLFDARSISVDDPLDLTGCDPNGAWG
jgi:DNA-binding HxlR family transcriptional regulator